MTTTALTTRGNLVLLPGVAEPARSVVAPRRHRSLWRKPWWWLPVRYRMAPSAAALQKRVEQLEAALIVVGTQMVPGGAV